MARVTRVSDLVKRARRYVGTGMSDAEAALKVLDACDLHELFVVDHDEAARIFTRGLTAELNWLGSPARLRSGPGVLVRAQVAEEVTTGELRTVRVTLLDVQYNVDGRNVFVRDMSPAEVRATTARLRAIAYGELRVADELDSYAAEAEARGLERIGDLPADALEGLAA